MSANSKKSEMHRFIRMTLAAATMTPVYPVMSAHNVKVGNATSDELQMHSSEDAADLEYLVIGAGFEEVIQTARRVYTPDNVNPAFWLYSAVGGTVVITWF